MNQLTTNTYTTTAFRNRTKSASVNFLQFILALVLLVVTGNTSTAQTVSLGCEATDEEFGITYVKYNKNSNNTVTLTFTVQVKNNHAFSHVSFELPAGTKASNTQNTNTKFTYTVENPTHNPFYSVNFQAKNTENYKNGASDTFSFTIPTANFEELTSIRVEAKAATITRSVSFKTQICQPEPLTIIGPKKVELNSTVVYTASGMNSNSTVYEWTVPAGWEIIKGQGTNSVTVKTGRKSGIMSVKKEDDMSATMLSIESYEPEPTVLPVTLVSFEAKSLTNGQVSLKWATASEIDNKEFVVERSVDAKSFTAVETIKGNGTSSTLINYSFVDQHASNGITYYRLKQVDYNDAFEYSKVVAVKSSLAVSESKLKTTVYPNPFIESLTVEVQQSDEKAITFSLTDMSGKVVATKSVQSVAGTSTITFDGLNEAPVGIYFLRVNQGEQSTVHKLVKNK